MADLDSSTRTQLVVGAGEVGTALTEVLGCELRDVQPFTGRFDVLHIAFPYSARFVTAVHSYVDIHRPTLVVVHSTVPVGTCDPYGWVHSPIRGQHPHLEDGVRVFTKHVGGRRADEAATLFEAAGVRTLCHPSARDTEAGKLVELARLGVEVRVEKEIDAYCRAHGLDRGVVYDAFTRTYNDGYARVGERRFTKPLLAHVTGPLGGHCVAENTPLLMSDFFDRLVGPVSKEGWTGELD